MIPYAMNDSYFEVMRKYINSNRALFISPQELIKLYAVVHNFDTYCAEDVVNQLLYELNNIVFSTVPVKMSDILSFCKNYICMNRNICFCFLADFYVLNVERNTELQGE